MAEKSDDTTVARANLVEQIACDDARLSAVEKIRRIKEEVGSKLLRALVVVDVRAC